MITNVERDTFVGLLDLSVKLLKLRRKEDYDPV